MKVGAKIKHIRELKDLKREYLAEQLNTSAKTIARLERDEISPTIDRLSEIATILEVSVSEILGFDAKQVFNNSPSGQQGGEFNAYNATEIKYVRDLYERLLAEKDRVIETLQGNVVKQSL